MKQNIHGPIEREKLAVPISRRDHSQGPSKATVTLLEYGDYECPYCGTAHQVVRALQKTLGDRMRFVFRNFPLTNIHPHAEHAAEVAEAAGAKGRFWEMHDTLYENQDALEDDDLAEYVAAIGLDPRELMPEVISGAHQASIRKESMGGVQSGVNGTPTFFINNLRYDGPDDYEGLLAELVAASEQKGK
jgi:protein-disulfide isomerase